MVSVPALPPEWQSMTYPVTWRGARLRVAVSAREVTITAPAATDGPVPVRVAGTATTVSPGEALTMPV